MSQIGVFGGSNSAELSPKTKRLAEEIGEEIAKSGNILVCGGLGGVMELAAKGAKKYNGLVVGIIPFCDRKIANKHIDIVICSGMDYYLRGTIVAHSSDAVIALPGETGTIAEICTMIGYKKPIVALKQANPMTGLPKLELFDKRKKAKIQYAKNAKDAVEKASVFLRVKK